MNCRINVNSWARFSQRLSIFLWTQATAGGEELGICSRPLVRSDPPVWRQILAGVSLNSNPERCKHHLCAKSKPHSFLDNLISWGSRNMNRLSFLSHHIWPQDVTVEIFVFLLSGQTWTSFYTHLRSQIKCVWWTVHVVSLSLFYNVQNVLIFSKHLDFQLHTCSVLTASQSVTVKGFTVFM